MPDHLSKKLNSERTTRTPIALTFPLLRPFFYAKIQFAVILFRKKPIANCQCCFLLSVFSLKYSDRNPLATFIPLKMANQMWYFCVCDKVGGGPAYSSHRTEGWFTWLGCNLRKIFWSLISPEFFSLSLSLSLETSTDPSQVCHLTTPRSQSN